MKEPVRMVAGFVQVTQEMLDDAHVWDQVVAAAKAEREFVRLNGPRYGPPLPAYCDECHQLVGPGYR